MSHSPSLTAGESQKPSAIVALGFVAIVGLYLWHALSIGYVVDDAYISLRYAHNFAEGHGLVYNVGDRVEGYTNFLWVLSLGIIARIIPSVDLLVVAQAISLAFGVLTLALMFIFARRSFKASPWLWLAGPLMLACNSSFCAWSTGGLASTVYAFLIFLALVMHDKEFRTGQGALGSVIPIALLSLVRGDGFVWFALFSVVRIFEHIKRGESPINRRSIIWCGVFFSVLVPYIGWRMWYYGYPLPNTYYAKVGGSFDLYMRGLRYTKHFLSLYGGALWMTLIAFSWIKRDAAPWVRGGILIALGWFAYIIQVGGDGLAFFRFFGYIMPVLYMLAATGLYEIMSWAKAHSQEVSWLKLRIALTAVVLLTAGLGTQQSNHVLRYANKAIAPYHHFDNYFIERCSAAGRWLAENSEEDDVIASTPAGAISYFSNRSVIDMLGLTDQHIARVPTKKPGKGRAGHEKGDGAYVLSKKPEFILLGNVAVGREPMSEEDIERDLCLRSEHEIWATPAFHETYKLQSVRLSDAGPFQYFTFYRKKS